MCRGIFSDSIRILGTVCDKAERELVYRDNFKRKSALFFFYFSMKILPKGC